MKVLIAEDDLNIANSLRKNFTEEKIETEIVTNGGDVVPKLSNNGFDVLLLDLRMPNKNGIEVCQLLREQHNSIPILLLTAISDVNKKIEALECGADDYITKPFSFQEVLARINAVVRRQQTSITEINFCEMKLNLVEHKLFIKNNEIRLTEKEFELLKYFVDNKGSIINKEELCKNVWHYNFIPDTNIVEAAIKNLRKKLEEHCDKKFIKNVYGEGYILIEE